MEVSVIIITLNEEKNIGGCIESAKWADEIIIVDSGSTDNTVKTAENYGCRIFFRKWTGYADQKRYALSLAKNNWVLSLDADERITDELMNEIKNLKEDDVCGYLIRRENHFLGKKISTCGWDKDFQMRLFRKDKTTVTNHLVHEGFVAEGTERKLENVILHYTYSDLHSAFYKINNYSSLQAQETYNSKNSSIAAVIFHSLSAFLRFFISLKGYKDGMHGFMISVLNSVTTMQTYMKIWEIKNIQSKEKI